MVLDPFCGSGTVLVEAWWPAAAPSASTPARWRSRSRACARTLLAEAARAAWSRRARAIAEEVGRAGAQAPAAPAAALGGRGDRALSPPRRPRAVRPARAGDGHAARTSPSALALRLCLSSILVKFMGAGPAAPRDGDGEAHRPRRALALLRRSRRGAGRGPGGAGLGTPAGTPARARSSWATRASYPDIRAAVGRPGAVVAALRRRLRLRRAPRGPLPLAGPAHGRVPPAPAGRTAPWPGRRRRDWQEGRRRWLVEMAPGAAARRRGGAGRGRRRGGRPARRRRRGGGPTPPRARAWRSWRAPRRSATRDHRLRGSSAIAAPRAHPAAREGSGARARDPSMLLHGSPSPRARRSNTNSTRTSNATHVPSTRRLDDVVPSRYARSSPGCRRADPASGTGSRGGRWSGLPRTTFTRVPSARSSRCTRSRAAGEGGPAAPAWRSPLLPPGARGAPAPRPGAPTDRAPRSAGPAGRWRRRNPGPAARARGPWPGGRRSPARAPAGGSFSRRRALATVLRSLPTRSASASCV